MRVELAAVLYFFVATASAARPDTAAQLEIDRVKFRAFKQQYRPAGYATRAEEHARFQVFRSNLDLIAAANSDPRLTYTLGVGPFADVEEQEFYERFTSANPPGATPDMAAGLTYLGERKPDSTKLPASVDWVARGAVTSVKSQKGCGDCWAFAATGALEGAAAIATGRLANLSTQEFVDCCETGCHGGWSFKALAFAVNHTVCTWDSYPYTAKGDGQNCSRIEPRPRCTAGIAEGQLSGYESVPKTERGLMAALAGQPVAINMFADFHMAHYKSGVLAYSNCSRGTNHGVLAVGYGSGAHPSRNGTVDPTQPGMQYWKVKNSWGTGFGMEGYFLLARGKYPEGCGTASTLLTAPSYPVYRTIVVP